MVLNKAQTQKNINPEAKPKKLRQPNFQPEKHNPTPQKNITRPYNFNITLISYAFVMKNVLIKTYNGKTDSIEEYLLERGAKPEILRDDTKAPTNTDFCILYIDFENDIEFNRLKGFISKNKDLTCFALGEKCTKTAILRAHSLNCGICINKITDIGENYFKETPVPKEQTPVRKTLSSENKKLASEFEHAKILIVDDVIENINVLKDILAPFNFEFQTFTNPKSALNAIDETKFDLILLDVIMPEIDGFQLASLIRAGEINAKTPIVFISASVEKRNKITGYNLGAPVYIEKPVDPQTVTAQVYGILKAEKLTKELIDEKENFIAMLTHDLKTPIRAQIRALELILNGSFGALNTEQREILNDVMASNKYMQNMAENVLTNYKTENGKLKIQKNKNDIRKTVEETVESLKFLLARKKQQIKVICNNLDNTVANYDEIEIKRVLANLIVNASEYSTENSVIKINIDKKGHDFKIAVTDTGLGIKMENPENLFKKYMTNSKKYKKIGTGLGLYICKAIVTAHGGTICAKNLKSGGASFSFTLNAP